MWSNVVERANFTEQSVQDVTWKSEKLFSLFHPSEIFDTITTLGAGSSAMTNLCHIHLLHFVLFPMIIGTFRLLPKSCARN